MTLTQEEKIKFKKELKQLIFRNFAMKNQLSNKEIHELLSEIISDLVKSHA